ncbi:MFS transporter [Actinopolymorpha pittospori]|uniref:Sugar phosphate permease n=1 Tax=Actinopolymorpha pittospori TaxID=648752 RepID=A0A927RLJ7_9ACTN|nr:sugar phosphate permease [Actinopolymorpha pittospori]
MPEPVDTSGSLPHPPPRPTRSTTPSAPRRGLPRIHRAWIVAAVALLALVGAAGFGATPGVLVTPLQEEFGWSRGTISLAISINLVLYGLTAPFAAALMDRFGIRRVLACALLLIALGSGLTVFMTQSWQLVLCWGILVGLGTGSMALGFVAIITGRWFVKQRGLVTGVLTAGGATGRLIFLPILATLAVGSGWRTASWTVTIAALAVVPLVVFFLWNHPRDVGVRAYGASEDEPDEPTPHPAAGRALAVLAGAARTKAFWLLAVGFAICGISTNGLIQIHLIPAAHDHGMPEPVAASLLALIGVLDVVGTVISGWLTDRVPAPLLLGLYYALRGGSLLLLPSLLDASAHPSLLIFIVFYGLDWVATVPPTIALCRTHFGTAGPIVFGWVFAAHQLGAAVAATAAGVIRDDMGSYTLAFTGAGLLCFVAAAASIGLSSRSPTDEDQGERTDEAGEGTDGHDGRVAAGSGA